MTTTQLYERLTVPDIDELSQFERIAEAEHHEAVAIGVIEETEQERYTDAPPVGVWKSLMHREVVAHYAQSGEEDAAREILTKVWGSDMFAARLAVLKAFNNPGDRGLILSSLGRDSFVPTRSKRSLELLAYDLSTGLGAEDLGEDLAAIPGYTERTIARIMVAEDPDEVTRLKESYISTSMRHDGDKPVKHFEYNTGKARVNIAAATSNPELHDDAIVALTELARPDLARQETEGYTVTLLDEDRRDAVEDVLVAVTRNDEDSFYHRNVLSTIAHATLDVADINRLEQSVRRMKNKYLKTSFLEDIAQIYADLGGIDAVEGLVDEINEFDDLYGAYSKSLALLGLLRVCLTSGEDEKAAVAYARSKQGGGRSSAVEGRLMLARHLRLGNPGSIHLTF